MKVLLELDVKGDPSLFAGSLILTARLDKILNNIKYICICGQILTTTKEDVSGNGVQRAGENATWLQKHRECK